MLIKRNNSTTKGFYFGKPEAEGEVKKGHSLSEYFEDYLGILNKINDNFFIISGRKGAGKSAIAKYILDSSSTDNKNFADLVRIQDLALEKILQSRQGEEVGKEALPLLIEWIILTRIIRLIVKNDSNIYTNEYKRLLKFLEINTGLVDIDKLQIESILEKKGIQIEFEVLKPVFRTLLDKHFNARLTRAPFYSFIPALREILSKVLSFDVNRGANYTLLFDDLDLTFETIASNRDQFMNLIRVARQYNLQYSDNGVKILMFIRDDVKALIVSDYPDSAKIFDSYEVNINWYDHEAFKLDEEIVALKKIVNKRISINFDNHHVAYDKNDPWQSLFPNHMDYGRSSFKYLLDYTFYRPRDLVSFLGKLTAKEYPYPVDYFTMNKLIQQYVISAISEIKNELTLHFEPNVISNIFKDLLFRIYKEPNLTYSQLPSLIEQVNVGKSTPHEVEKILTQYSLIGIKKIDNSLLYRYREDVEYFLNPETDRVILPKIFTIYYNYYKG
jgi:hypothetical protein